MQLLGEINETGAHIIWVSNNYLSSSLLSEMFYSNQTGDRKVESKYFMNSRNNRSTSSSPFNLCALWHENLHNGTTNGRILIARILLLLNSYFSMISYEIKSLARFLTSRLLSSPARSTTKNASSLLIRKKSDNKSQHKTELCFLFCFLFPPAR